MDIKIRVGTEKDLDSIAQLYDAMNDHLAATANYPGWKKGVYPIREDAVNGINEGSLFVVTENEEIVGSMILRHQPEPAYLTVTWQTALDYKNVLVIYTFVVHPQKLQHGVGRKMLEFAAQYAEDNQIKALRLDVYEKNIPAIRLYEKCGYRYIDTVSLGLEEHGLNWFRLYEKVL
jgi:ribosomal protein S18 acetylase RimI-like enzyme